MTREEKKSDRQGNRDGGVSGVSATIEPTGLVFLPFCQNLPMQMNSRTECPEAQAGLRLGAKSRWASETHQVTMMCETEYVHVGMLDHGE